MGFVRTAMANALAREDRLRAEEERRREQAACFREAARSSAFNLDVVKEMQDMILLSRRAEAEACKRRWISLEKRWAL